MWLTTSVPLQPVPKAKTPPAICAKRRRPSHKRSWSSAPRRACWSRTMSTIGSATTSCKSRGASSAPSFPSAPSSASSPRSTTAASSSLWLPGSEPAEASDKQPKLSRSPESDGAEGNADSGGAGHSSKRRRWQGGAPSSRESSPAAAGGVTASAIVSPPERPVASVSSPERAAFHAMASEPAPSFAAPALAFAFLVGGIALEHTNVA
mmetsp:Transcript_16940/g.48113  ORF Transcript_16940/g.48113 Transcript_16940/m.48113 type:complete len:208 (+) Transcript_16940:1291-1914(+)